MTLDIKKYKRIYMDVYKKKMDNFNDYVNKFSSWVWT